MRNTSRHQLPAGGVSQSAFLKSVAWLYGGAFVYPYLSHLLIFLCQEKELAKEMGGLSVEASNSTASSGGAGGATDGVKKYNKSSFFDEISCDVLDRAAGTGARVDDN